MSEYLDDTFTKSIKQNGYSSEDILEKYPFLVPRASMLRAITDSGLAGNTQRNPNGYTAAEITEKVIEYWDEVISAWWPNKYYALAFLNVNNQWKMNQVNYWSEDTWSLIYHNGGSDGYAAGVLHNTDIVILPGNYYPQENVQNYRNKTWLGFDNRMMRSNFAAELTNTNGIIQGVTSGGLTDDDDNNPITNGNLKPSFMVVYSNMIWHPVLAPNGLYNSVSTDPDPADWSDITTSTKYYDLSHALFDVTVYNGVVISVVAQSRLDGLGNAVTGGWNYSISDDYRELQILDTFQGTSADWSPPRILVRTNEDQPGYPNNRVTVDQTQPDQEFWGGKNIVDGTYTGILTGFNVGFAGEAARDLTQPIYDYDSNWYDRNWPTEPRISDIRITINRPVLKTKSRSLRETKVATGAHSMSFEFNYPPMIKRDADRLITAYELCRGASRPMQIYIPKEVMEYQEMVYDNTYPAAPTYGVIQYPTGNVGSSEIVVDGFEAGYQVGDNWLYGNKWYLLLHAASKLYRVIRASTADAYGRVTFKIEPPLLQDQNGLHIIFDNERTGMPATGGRIEYIPMQVFMDDDSFEVTQDAAGLYRCRVKFTEAMI
jgi:hypothetical protein